MKAITLTQPYATLVAIGAKQIETRSWATKYRGPLAIHAAKGLGPVGGKSGLEELCAQEPFCSILTVAIKQHYAPFRTLREMVEHEFMPLGAIVAVCELVDCRSTSGTPTEYGPGPKYADWVHTLSEKERAFGDYAPGRYGFALANVRALAESLPAKGALSLWDWTPPDGWEMPA